MLKEIRSSWEAVVHTMNYGTNLSTHRYEIWTVEEMNWPVTYWHGFHADSSPETTLGRQDAKIHSKSPL